MSGLEFLQQESHQGVKTAIPQRVSVLSSSLPLSWTRRPIEVTTTDGASVVGTLLSVSTAGLVMLARLSSSEVTRRQISWHAIQTVDLQEDL